MIVADDLFKSVQVTELISSKNVNRELKTQDEYGFSTTTTPLHVAVEHGHVRIVEHLLKIGADVDKKDSSMTTPLDVAVFKKVSLLMCTLQCNIEPQKC